MNPTLARIGSLVVVLAMLLGGLLVVARPWYRDWGATDAETLRRLPGDDLVPDATEQGTRAITIDAPASRVWPWLAQTGQDRGGFHSYELLEDLAGCEMENLPYLDPKLQQWKIGDKL